MDPLTAIQAIPGIGPYLPYVALTIALAASGAPFLKPPTNAASGFYPVLYGLVNFIALNMGHAKNATAPGIPPIDTPNVTRMLPIAVALSFGLLLQACSTPPTQRQQTITAVSTLAVDLAQIAAAHNQTVQALLDKGVAICGKASSVQGQLLIGTAVAVADAAGVPVSVTGQAADDVAAACAPLGLVPGPAPPAQAVIPVAAVPATALPPVPAS